MKARETYIWLLILLHSSSFITDACVVVLNYLPPRHPQGGPTLLYNIEVKCIDFWLRSTGEA